jgi:hypothetical protein
MEIDALRHYHTCSVENATRARPSLEGICLHNSMARTGGGNQQGPTPHDRPVPYAGKYLLFAF